VAPRAARLAADHFFSIRRTVMATTLRAFERNILDLVRGLEEAVGDIVAEMGERVHGALVLANPVDRSDLADDVRSQSNWLIGVNGADLSFAPLRSENETITAGQNVLRGRRFRASDEVVIANGGAKVPYLARLDQGYSRQAPAGFVLAAIQAGVRAAAEARLLREGPGPLRFSRRKV